MNLSGQAFGWKSGSLKTATPEVLNVELKGGAGVSQTTGGKNFVGLDVGGGLKAVVVFK